MVPVPGRRYTCRRTGALVSAFARYRLSPAFSVQLNLNNLLDKRYYAQIYGYGAWGEPRNGTLSFSWSF
ncbi:TonB-dependent receptor [Xanthomonas sp. LMG 12462]|nr:TonB-dependent receptor [Xanthomonas sp. LMG 12462]